MYLAAGVPSRSAIRQSSTSFLCALSLLSFLSEMQKIGQRYKKTYFSELQYADLVLILRSALLKNCGRTVRLSILSNSPQKGQACLAKCKKKPVDF